MFLQRYRLDHHRFPEVWVLRFKDQRGNSVREIVGPDLNDAVALLQIRRDQVRDGTYMGRDEFLRMQEQKRGRPLSPEMRELMVNIEFGPQTLDSWLFCARWFGYFPPEELCLALEPVPDIQLPRWLTEPWKPPSVVVDLRSWRKAAERDVKDSAVDGSPNADHGRSPSEKI